jgi:transposase
MKTIPAYAMDVHSYYHGKMNFIACICKKLSVSAIFEDNLTKSNRRKPDIPYGTMAELMITNLCDSHRPLYLMQEYFSLYKDLEGIFHQNIDINQLNDDRFANFLDQLHAAGPRKIFSEISAYAFSTYGLTVKTVNFDTTSKVMWGEYETPEGKVGTVSINFGYSKNKREDKKQIKIGIGTANGIIADAKVLSGNVDDKTYNFNNLDDVDALLERTHTDKSGFYYIADSALFTENNVLKAQQKNIKFITRIPETTKMANKLINKALNDNEFCEQIILINAQQKEVKYDVYEYVSDYKGIATKCAVCYSYTLEETKNKTIWKQVYREEAELEKIMKEYNKREFACQADAQKEIDDFMKKKHKKIKFHSLTFTIHPEERRKVGRPAKNQSVDTVQYTYFIQAELSQEEDKIKQAIKQACFFVLGSNDISISAENILREYKTQSSVEKKFQQLKSPNFVNSLFIKTPERVEALTYIMLITMMILSVTEHVVRRELKKENAIVIGPGKIKMKQPTLRAIIEIFNSAAIQIIKQKNVIQRVFQSPLNESQIKIMRYLRLEDNIFLGSTS